MGTELVASADECWALIRLLALIEPDVESLAGEHREEHGELLITVFLGDLARRAFDGTWSPALTDAINALLVAGSPGIRNVLLTGFVEGVPVDLDPDRCDALPEPLRSEVRKDLGWDQ